MRRPTNVSPYAELLGHLERLGRRGDLASAQFNLGYCALLAGELDVADRYFQASEKLALEAVDGERYTLAWALTHEALTALLRGDLSATAALLDRAQIERLQELRLQNMAVFVRTWARALRGEGAEAAAELVAALAAARRSGSPALVDPSGSLTHRHLAHLHLLAGDTGRALESLPTSGATSTEPIHFHQAERCALEVVLLFRLDREAEACAVAKRLRGQDREDLCERLHAKRALGLARTCAPDHDRAAAIAELEAVEREARRHDHVLIALDARLDRGLLQLKHGERAAGVRTLRLLLTEARRRQLVAYERAARNALGAAARSPVH